MTPEEVLAFIKASDDRPGLREIQQAAKSRLRELWDADQKKAAADAWDQVKFLKNGDEVYCHAPGSYLRYMKHGEKAVVYTVQPRKKRIWLTIEGKGPIAFGPMGCKKYGLSQFPPTD